MKNVEVIEEAPGRRERVEYRADGTVATRAVAQLDEQGRPRIEEWFDAAGGFKSRDEYTWRGDDLVRVMTYLADGTSFVAFEDDDA